MNILKKFTDYWANAIQRSKPIESTIPFLNCELAITEEAMYKRMKTVPYSPDALITKKRIQIYDDMMKDAEVESAINTLKTIRLSSGWKIESASNDVRDEEIADFVQWNFDNVEGSFDDDLREMFGAVEMGVSINEEIWRVIKKKKYEGMIQLQNIKSKNPKYFNICTDDFDNILENGIVNISSIDFGREYPTEKFIIYSFNKRYENVFGTARLRALYDLWFLKQVFIRAWGIFSEKFGMPFPVLKHPPINEVDRNKLLEVIKQIRMESGLLIPKELEFELKEVSSRPGTFFVDSIKEINAEIRKTVLGQTLTGETGGTGSYALGKVHFDILLFYEEQLGKDISEKAINQQIIKRLVDYNYSDIEEYPKFIFNPLVQEDVTAIIDKYYVGVQAGIIKPIPEDETQIREWLHLPKRKIEEIPEQSVMQEKNKDIILFKDNEEDYKSNKIMTGVIRRKFTVYEEVVDFVEIKNDIENITEKYVPKASLKIKEGVEGLIKEISKLKIIENKDYEAIKNLHFVTTGELKELFFSMLQEQYNNGMKQARQEILNKRKQAKKFSERQRNIIKHFQEIELRNLTLPEALYWFESDAYNIAGIEQEYIRGKVTRIIMEAIRTGKTMRESISEIQKVLEPYYQRGLVEEEAMTGYRLETVFRTNTMKALIEGRKAVFESPDLEGFVQAYQISCVLDARVRPGHVCMDESIYPVLSPIWTAHSYPRGFNCRCALVEVTEVDEWKESSPPSASCQPDAGF